MFSRGQPREVYRVYGEDDFFAEQDSQQDPHPQPEYAQPEPVRGQPPTAPVRAPAAAEAFSEQPTSEYAPPEEYHQAAAVPLYGEQPLESYEHNSGDLSAHPGGVYGEQGARRRMTLIIALGAILAVLLVALLISSLSSSHTPKSARAQAQPLAAKRQPQTPKVSRSPAARKAPSSVRHPRRVRVTHRVTHPVPRVRIHYYSSPVPVSTHLTQSHPVTPVASAPAPVAVSTPTPSYTPAPAATGTEFGFEH